MADEPTVRKVHAEDAEQLAQLLNEIIARGGTTAYQDPFSAGKLCLELLTGPEVVCCFVAVDSQSGALLGFQSLVKGHGLPDDVADIATFSRVGLTQKGVGSALFSSTRPTATSLGLKAINATIRADNAGGLIFYGRAGLLDVGMAAPVALKNGVAVDRINKRFDLTTS